LAGLTVTATVQAFAAFILNESDDDVAVVGDAGPGPKPGTSRPS
jgi:hypothetical protein